MIGICPQSDILFDMLTVEEHLILFAKLHGYANFEIKERVADSLKTVGLEFKKNEVVTSLSGGMKRRVSVAMAIIGDPKVFEVITFFQNSFF